MWVRCGRFDMPKDMEAALAMAAETCERNGYDCFPYFSGGKLADIHLFGKVNGDTVSDMMVMPGERGWDIVKWVEQ